MSSWGKILDCQPTAPEGNIPATRYPYSRVIGSPMTHELEPCAKSGRINVLLTIYYQEEATHGEEIALGGNSGIVWYRRWPRSNHQLSVALDVTHHLRAPKIPMFPQNTSNWEQFAVSKHVDVIVRIG